LDGKETIDYALNLQDTIKKAYKYMFNTIKKEMFEPFDVYINLLDKTKIEEQIFK